MKTGGVEARLKSIHCLLVALALAATSWSLGAETAPGRVTGGIAYALPAWFKASFLDIREDVTEARKRGRHVMIFLHLDECPYCARMIQESFTSGDNHDFIRKHFDVIAINVRGDLEVVWTDGATYTERKLAGHLKAFATPTLVFLGDDGKNLLQLTGYRDPIALRQAIEYIQIRGYRASTFQVHLETRANQPALYAFRQHPLFAKATNFKGYKKPLAILWEDRQCVECARFHERTLNHPDVIAEMKRFTFVRLDADSNQTVIDIDGNATTPAQWVKALGLTYRPALVLYDGGREIFRSDGRLYHFHFREALRYVSGGHYKRYANISQYNAARRNELLKQGVRIDYSE